MVINMKIILPLALPIINTYPCIANPLSIIQLNPDSRDWIYSNFLSLSARRESECNSFAVYLSNGAQLWTDILIWEKCPYISFWKIERWIFEQYRIDIVDFIIQAINREQYVYLYVRKADIYEYKSTDLSRSHDIMIYGYDTENAVFYAKDYFDVYYESRIIEQNQLRTAFNMCSKNKQKDMLEGVICFSQPNGDEAKRNLAMYEKCSPTLRYINLYRENLDEFLGFRYNSEKNANTDIFFNGINVFDAFSSYIASSSNFPFHITCDIQLMIDFFNILSCIMKNGLRNEIIESKLKEIQKKLKHIQMSFMKLSIKGKSDLICRAILLSIMQVRELAYNTVMSMRDYLSKISYIGDEIL